MIEYEIDILVARYRDGFEARETVRVHEHGAVSVLHLERPTGQVAISTERLKFAVNALAQEPAGTGLDGFMSSVRERVRALGGPQLGDLSSGAAVAIVRVLDAMAGSRAWRNAYPDLADADAPMRGYTDPRPVAVENRRHKGYECLELWGCARFETRGRRRWVVLRQLRDYAPTEILFDLETGLPKRKADQGLRVSFWPQLEIVHNVPGILLTLGSLRKLGEKST